MELQLVKGGIVLIDSEDYEMLSRYKWRLHQRKKRITHYAACPNINGKFTYMHRLLMKAQSGQEVDHIDGNGLNNQKANLRLCSRKENSRNRLLQSNNTSGKSGVYFSRINKNWVAQITSNRINRYIGSFPSKEEAIAARNCKEIEIFGEFSPLHRNKNK